MKKTEGKQVKEMCTRDYTNVYRLTHPEKVEQYRINAAKKLLEKNGYTVSKTEG